MTSLRQGWLRHGAVLLAYVALAVAMTWPLATHLATHVVRAKWYYDSMVNIHILGSRVHYAMGMSESLRSAYDNYFCAPTPYSIVDNENHFGLAVVYAPFLLVTQDPLTAYNLLLLACLALSGFFTFLLVRELSGNAMAAFLAGVGYAFCPYIFFELGRLQLVAAQWIPLFALFLHRAALTPSWSNILGAALTFAMQVGCCLYYALFLAIYTGLVGTWLFIRHRTFSRTLVVRVAVAGALAGSLTGGMVYPYFRARQDYALTRSQDITRKYAGKLEHLVQVFPENKALGFLHERAEGPDEPIAFPGFTLLALAAVAFLASVVSAARAAPLDGRLRVLSGVLLVLVGLAGATAISFWTQTFLAGLLLALMLLGVWRWLRREPVLPPLIGIYGTLLVLTLVLFLGPVPFENAGAPVHGLYYYLYRYVPGFDGIRYVSRLAVMLMFTGAVLAGLGATFLLRTRLSFRLPTFVVLLAVMLFELRNAPVTLARLPTTTKLPEVYKWLAKRPGPEPIATIPAYPIGYFGARNDFFALYHRRRTVDGKSSWMPPITHAYILETRRFPRRTMTRLLQALGVKYLVIHHEELGWARAKRVTDWIAKRPEAYRKRFEAGSQAVYEIVPSKDGSTSLLPTPKLPEGAVRVPRESLRAYASRESRKAFLAVDGRPGTKWVTSRYQLGGDWFELVLSEPERIVAIELTDFDEAFEAPAAFKISSGEGDGTYRTLVTRPELRFYRDQVYRPRSFVFRVVLPEPVVTDTLRIDLTDGVAGRRWAIHEAAVWTSPENE
jgi:hypothetical protein